MGYCLIFLNLFRYSSSLFYFKFFDRILSDNDLEHPGAPIIRKGNLVLIHTKHVYKFSLRESFRAIGLSQFMFSLEQKSDY